MTEPVKRASAWVKREWTNEEADKRFKAGYGPEEHFVWYNPMSWPPEYRMQLPVQAAYWGGTYIMNYYKQRPWYAGEWAVLTRTHLQAQALCRSPPAVWS
jgi:hypothetical protein